MNSLLKQLQKLNNTKDHKLVFGYVKSITGNIPMLVFYICLANYHLKEYFEQCCNGLTIMNDRSTIIYQNEVNSDKSPKIAICHQKTSQKSINQWTFKINNCMNRMYIYLKEDLNDEIFFAFDNHGCVHINQGGIHTIESSTHWSTHDEIVVVLNMSTQTVSVGLKNEPLTTIIDLIWTDRGYTLMIGLCDVNDTVTLNKFSSI